MAKKVSRCFSPEATHDESKPPPPPRQRTIGHQCLYRLSRISCLHTEQGWFPDRLLLPFVNRSILFHEIAEIQYTSVSPLIGQLSFVFIHMHITRSYRIFTFFPWCDMEMPISIVIIVGFVREIRSNLRTVCAYPNGDYPNWSKLNPDYNKKKEIEKNRKTPRNCAYGASDWNDTTPLKITRAVEEAEGEGEILGILVDGAEEGKLLSNSFDRRVRDGASAVKRESPITPICAR